MACVCGKRVKRRIEDRIIRKLSKLLFFCAECRCAVSRRALKRGANAFIRSQSPEIESRYARQKNKVRSSKDESRTQHQNRRLISIFHAVFNLRTTQSHIANIKCFLNGTDEIASKYFIKWNQKISSWKHKITSQVVIKKMLFFYYKLDEMYKMLFDNCISKAVMFFLAFDIFWVINLIWVELLNRHARRMNFIILFLFWTYIFVLKSFTHIFRKKKI